MKEFDFLRTYIERLSGEERNDPESGYILREGIPETRAEQLASEAGIPLPEDLKEFYRFSYGALLNDYEILTIPEIVNVLTEVRATDEDFWEDSILPFAYVRGVGDVVAFDLNESNEAGQLLVLDGFHEYPPTQWEGVCYGLVTWLRKMVLNDFHPFWLK